MSQAIFKNHYIEITLLEQIKRLFLSEIDAFLYFFKKIQFIAIFISIIIIISYFNFFILWNIILYILSITLSINFFFIIIIPLLLRPKIFYNSTYKSISFTQKELIKNINFNSYNRNIILISFSGFTKEEDKKEDNQINIVIFLVYFKIITYNLSSLKKNYIVYKIIYLISNFILTLLFVFYTLDILQESNLITENWLFIYSMFYFFLYSLYVFILINSSSSFYIRNLKFEHRIEIYNKYFLFDFILYKNFINSKEIYKSVNILEKEKNYFMHILLAGIFWIYIPLMYDKIYNVNVNVKSIDSKIIKIKENI